MPWVGLEPTIPAFERVKTVHALDHAATVITVLVTADGYFPRGKATEVKNMLRKHKGGFLLSK
jgi:hypothetical protein